MYYVYIIESLTTHKWYYGYTKELDQRIDAHNKGLNISTANRGPWKYIFKRSFNSDKDARSFEVYLKKSKNKQYIKRQFAQYFIN
jgi:putative endonuclease